VKFLLGLGVLTLVGFVQLNAVVDALRQFAVSMIPNTRHSVSDVLLAGRYHLVRHLSHTAKPQRLTAGR